MKWEEETGWVKWNNVPQSESFPLEASDGRLNLERFRKLSTLAVTRGERTEVMVEGRLDLHLCQPGDGEHENSFHWPHDTT